ncbi:MAG: hypothetical protein ACYC2H_02020 [Thermoplasmatota archaeon]
MVLRLMLAGLLLAAMPALAVIPAADTSGDVIFDQTFVVSAGSPKTFTVSVPATAGYTMHVSTGAAAFNTMTVASFPGCAGWQPYTTQVIQSGPLYGNNKYKDCGSVSSGSHNLTVSVGSGFANTRVRIYET